MVKNINTVNMYEMNTKFDKLMDTVKQKWDIDDEVIAECCLSWVRQNAVWNTDRDKTVQIAMRELEKKNEVELAEQVREVLL